MNLGDVVKECMREKGLSVKELAELTGIAPTTLYSFFSRGGKGLSISSFLKIAQVLEVSADELYARSEIQTRHAAFFLNDENRDYFRQNLKSILSERGISYSQICDDLKISPSRFNRWIVGELYPRMGDIGVLTEYLNVSKEDLMGIKATVYGEKTEPATGNISQFCKEHLREIKSINTRLNEDESKIIESYRRSDKITKEAINRLLAYDDQIIQQKEFKKKKDSD